MNIVFLVIKVIDFKYNFLLKKKQSAICKIDGILKNNSKIRLVAYNETADRCMKILKKGQYYFIQGQLSIEMALIDKIIDI